MSESFPEDILINFTPQETRVAVMYQGVVQELHIERNASRGLVGNIYLGRVVRILPGMQSAFVDVGLQRTAFLHVADIWESRNPGEPVRPIERILQRGVAQGLFKDQLSAVDVHYLISALSGFRVDHAATWHSLLQVDLLGENLRARHLQLLLDQLGALVCKEQG